MGEKILKFEIPVPADARLLQAYLDLGWSRLRGLFGEPDYLKWSHGKGSPQRPRDVVREGRRLNQADVMLAIIDMASVDGDLPPEDAIAQIAAFIDRLAPSADTYECDVAALLGIGACIWKMQRP